MAPQCIWLMVIWGTARTHADKTCPCSMLKWQGCNWHSDIFHHSQTHWSCIDWFFDGDNLKFNKYPPQRKWLYISIAVESFFPEFTHHVGHPIPWVIHLGLYVYFSGIPEFCLKKTSCVANPSSWVQKSAPKCTSWEKWAAWCLKKCLKMKNFNTKRHQAYFKNWSSMSDVLRHLKLWDVKSGSESDIANYIFPGSQYGIWYIIYTIYIIIYKCI